MIYKYLVIQQNVHNGKEHAFFIVKGQELSPDEYNKNLDKSMRVVMFRPVVSLSVLSD